MEEYYVENFKTGRRIGYGLIVAMILFSTFSALVEGDPAIVIAASFVFFWGYAACHLIHKSRMAILKREAKNIILQYHDHRQPNVQPQQPVYRSPEVHVMGQVQQYGDKENLIKYIEKL